MVGNEEKGATTMIGADMKDNIFITGKAAQEYLRTIAIKIQNKPVDDTPSQLQNEEDE